MRRLGKVKKKASTLILMLLLIIIQAKSQDNLINEETNITELIKKAKTGKWETAKTGEGVTLSYRWLNFGNKIKTREIAVRFITEGNIQDILMNLRKKESLEQWNNSAREIKMLYDEGSTWITHTVYNIPYPLSQQDLVVKNTITKEGENVKIQINAVPDYIEPMDNVTRQGKYVGQWILKQLHDGKTEVYFSAVSFSKSSIPRFIRDPIIQYKLHQSFIKLKDLPTPAHVAKL